MADFSGDMADDALMAFVEANFILPKFEAPASEVGERASLQSYIAGLWTKLERHPEAVPAGSSALPLPESYVVPGGRFREIYYWDSYFTMLGLAEDGRDDLVEAMLHNFEGLIERFGHIPNGTRTYYLSRSQPPFLSLMVALSKTTSPSEKVRQLAALKSEHDYWMAGASLVNAGNPSNGSVVRLSDGSLLNRYWDERDTPRDESFAEDVETAKHSERLPAQVYRDLRAGAASGWDFSSRWLVEADDFASIHTTEIVPADLNSLLWMLETSIARLGAELRQSDIVYQFDTLADQRAHAMRRYLWVASEGRFGDYDIGKCAITPVISAATLYPLFVGLASQDEADAVAATVGAHLLARGGLRTTTTATDQQWDMPNGWAPLQWIAIDGLERYGHAVPAREIAARWLETVQATYTATGKLLEKYDIEHMKPGGGGEYPVQDGFGWTNGVTRALIARYPGLIE